MLRIFLRIVLKHNIHEVLTPAKRTTKNLQLNDPALEGRYFSNQCLQIHKLNFDTVVIACERRRQLAVSNINVVL